MSITGFKGPIFIHFKNALNLELLIFYQVPVRTLQPLFFAVHLSLLGPVEGGLAMGLFLLFQLLGLTFDLNLQLLVLVRAVHQKPGQPLN